MAETIDTVPKDGTPVLLYHPEYEHGWLVAFWYDPVEPGDTPDDAGWYSSEASGPKMWEPEQHPPFAWAPLPAPPCIMVAGQRIGPLAGA